MARRLPTMRTTWCPHRDSPVLKTTHGGMLPATAFNPRRSLKRLLNRTITKRTVVTDRSWPVVSVWTRARQQSFAKCGPSRLTGRPLLIDDQISVCSEISGALSTSMPRYLTVDSSLECPSSS